ncbi:MAG: SDR family oxidoreductase [Dehalococcoidia bacterium]|nr:SDR family oxidoreductase [Dehalococcoidia bacterium]
MGTLQGKTAIVAGASRGIGKVIATAYAREGARVVVAARTEAPGKIAGTIGETVAGILAAGGDALAVRCDVTSEEDTQALVRQAIAWAGGVDILVNSAAVIIYDQLAATTFKRWEMVYRVNVHGAFLLTKAVLPHMIGRNAGRIIQLTSGAALGARAGTSAYGSTKAALERMCATLATEVAPHNIAVSCLAPGPMKTEGALFGRGPNADWTGWEDPRLIEPVALYLAQADAVSLPGLVVRRADFDRREPAAPR